VKGNIQQNVSLYEKPGNEDPLKPVEEQFGIKKEEAFFAIRQQMKGGTCLSDIGWTEDEYLTNLLYFAVDVGFPPLEEGDLPKAEKAATRLEKEGFPKMADYYNLLGKAFYLPKQQTIDYEKAFQFFGKAYSHKNDKEVKKHQAILEETMFYLARCYHFGQGVNADELKADEYLKKLGNKLPKEEFYSLNDCYEYWERCLRYEKEKKQ
jgi:hypothetical protein